MRKLLSFMLVIVVLIFVSGCNSTDEVTQFEKNIYSFEDALPKVLAFDVQVNEIDVLNELYGENILLTVETRRRITIDLFIMIGENRDANLARIEEIRTLSQETKRLLQEIRTLEIELSESDKEQLALYVEILRQLRSELISDQRANERLLRVTRRNFRLRHVDGLIENFESIIEVQQAKTIIFDEVIVMFVAANELLGNYNA